jgi:TolB-like protein
VEKSFPAYQGTEQFVFVSYSHLDTEQVFSEITLLAEQGINIWYDEGIRPGAEWRDELALAIRNSSLFLFFVTPNSAVSDHCRKEIYFALDIGCPIIAVYLQKTSLPDGIHMALNDRQAIDKSSMHYQEYLKKLFSSVTSYIPSATQKESDEPIDDQLSQDQPSTADTSQPRVLVLPVSSIGQNTDDDFFIEGLIEDLVVGLSLSQWLTVIDSGTTFSYLGKKVDPGKTAKELGAAYVIHGRMRKSGKRIRATFYLTDASLGKTLWSQQFDCHDEQLFDMEDEIKHKVLSAIEPRYLEHQADNLEKSSPNMEQWQLVVKARQLFWRTTKDTTQKARNLLEKALKIENGDPKAWSLLAMTHMNDAWNGWSGSITESLSKADWASEKAVSLDDQDPAAHHARSTVRSSLGDLHQAEADLSRALELNPYFSAALGDMARIRVFSGNTEGAIQFAERAIEVSPRDPHIGLWHYWIALTHFVERDYTMALPYLEKATAIRPDWIIFNRLKVVCFALLGQIDRASSTLDDFKVSSAQNFENMLRANHPFIDDEPLDRYLDGLKKASGGLPEQQKNTLNASVDNRFNFKEPKD